MNMNKYCSIDTPSIEDDYEVSNDIVLEVYINVRVVKDLIVEPKSRR